MQFVDPDRWFAFTKGGRNSVSYFSSLYIRYMYIIRRRRPLYIM